MSAFAEVRLALAAGILAASVAVSGCASAPVHGPPPSTTTSPSSSFAPAVAGPPAAPGGSAPDRLAMNGCIGLETTLPYANLLGLHPATPKGWEPSASDDGTYVVKVNRCQRVS